jgi:hypothetical protein
MGSHRPHHARNTPCSFSRSCRGATTRWGRRSASSRTRAGGERWSRRQGGGGRAGARRRHRHGPGRGAAGADLGLPCRRPRPERRDARAGAGAARVGPGLGERVELVHGEAEPCRSATASSPASPSPTCSATSTIRPPRWPSSPAWSGPGGRSPRSSSASRGSLAVAWRLYTRRRAAGAGPAGGTAVVRGRALPRSEHRELLPRYPLERQLELWPRPGSAGSRAAHEPRRRSGDLGNARWRLTARPSTLSRPAGGATS